LITTIARRFSETGLYCEIEEFMAELLRFNHLQFQRRPTSWISLEVDFNHPPISVDE